ncbi:hypothetical protein [Cupriavidus pauculus]|uniref:hypothetical protein n=1 Tax=Cupriavidus pauculus TaxID=82633 RepID=UPI0011AEC676|nr:hypothetical protein [Cupriavidus pauculus]
MSTSIGKGGFAAAILMVSLALAASRNLVDYSQSLFEKKQLAREQADAPSHCESEDGVACNRAERRQLYALLESMGSDRSYHQPEHRTAVFVADDGFRDGVYIDEVRDSRLQRCAIQPFSIPGITGMPLLDGIAARKSGCPFDSYGYQYLPDHGTSSNLGQETPCSMAREHGFAQVAVIQKQDGHFVAEKRSCDPT